jgi:hypothetical protein
MISLPFPDVCHCHDDVGRHLPSALQDWSSSQGMKWRSCKSRRVNSSLLPTVTEQRFVSMNAATLPRVKHLKTWREFIKEINRIEDDIAKLSKKTIGSYSKPLYRGQPDSSWKLITTLERETTRPLTMASYHQNYVEPAYAMLSGFNEKHWPYDSKADCSYEALSYHRVPNYEFIGYLRHHGFPSPLLDWTSSPYIAAFFAFDVAYSAERVSIYWFQEYQGHGKSSSSNKPRIITAGPFVAIHKRHFLQQSEYSLCFEMKGSDALLMSHEIPFTSGSFWPQDNLIKFTLPRTLRSEVLWELNKMNINPYSVYQSEDSLVRTAGNRLFLEDAKKLKLIPYHKALLRKMKP